MHDETLRNTLSERFEGFSSQPNDAVWESIEKVLDEDEKAAGYRFNLLSPLVITLLIGSSAAALAFLVYFTNSEAGSTFPLADSYRSSHIQISDHTRLSLAADETSVPATIKYNTVLIHPSTPSLPTSEEYGNLSSFVIETQSIHPLKTKTLQDLSQNGACLVTSLSDRESHVPNTMHFDGADKIESYPPETHVSHSSLSAEFLLSTFDNVQGMSKSVAKYPDNTDEPIAFNSSKVVEKSNRFVEAELNFNGHFTRRIKGGVGVNLGYSREEGSIGTSTSYSTTQWSIGIPITIGIDIWRGGRFGVGIAAKLLNDFDQRKATELTALTFQSNLSPTVLQSTTVTKDQVYRFGFQPMLTASYYITPRTALSLGLSYRHYLKDSRESSVSFQRSHYLGVSLGLGFML